MTSTTTMNRLLPLFSGLLLAGAVPTVARAAATGDWPQWGGNDPGRNMYSPATGLPDRINPGVIKDNKVDLSTAVGVKWVAKLGSQSYGNATISGGKVFVGTNNESPRDPQHKADRSILMCLDEQTGEFLWQLVIPKLASGKVNDWESLGLLCSPTVEGDRVYIVTSRCEVMCLDVNGLANGNDGPYQDEAQYVVGPGKPKATLGPKDADIIWRYDMMDDLGVFPHNASNCSLLIVGDTVFACTSNGQDWTHANVPSPLAPSFVALNKKTGELTGEDKEQIGTRLFHGQWSSPSMGMVNGRTQVYFGGGDGILYAFDAVPKKEADGNFLPLIWKYDCNPPEYKMKDGKPIKYPEADGPSEINSTPVFYKGRVYVAIGQDPEHGEGVGRLVCVDPTKQGDVTKTATIWDYKGIHRSISTVSIDPNTGLLFVGDFSGFLHCLDAETGKLHWVHDVKAHLWSSTLVADGKVYLGDEDGDLLIMAATKEKKIISEVNLGAPIYSSPVVANGVLYIATQSHLYAFHKKQIASLEK